MKLFDEEGLPLEDSDIVGVPNESLVNVFVDLDTERDVRQQREELKLYKKSMAQKRDVKGRETSMSA